MTPVRRRVTSSRLSPSAGFARRFVVALIVAFAIPLITAANAQAQSPRPDIRIAPGRVPFSVEQLADAVALRDPHGASPDVRLADVVVTSPMVGQVSVRVGGRERLIDVARIEGADAARLVALMIWELMRTNVSLPGDGMSAPRPAERDVRGESSVADTAGTAKTAIAPAPESMNREPADVVRSLVRSPDRSLVRSPDRSPDRSPWSESALGIGVAAGLALRTTDAGASVSPSIEARWMPAGATWLHLVGAVAYDHADVTARDASGEKGLGVTTVPARIGVGTQLRWVDLRVGALGRLYFTDGFAQRAGALWGGFLSASVAFPTRGAWVPFGVAGLDVHAQPVTFTYANQPVLGLNAVCPWIGFGLAWRGRRA